MEVDLMESNSDWSDEEEGVMMSDVMTDLYYKKGLIDST
jgi:hypothetical protein